MESLIPYAELLDKVNHTDAHTKALAAQKAKIEDVELTPSSRYFKAVRDSGLSFNQFSKENSFKHSTLLRESVLPTETKAALIVESERSLAAQAEIEASDQISFEEYMQHFENSLMVPEEESEAF
jgi:glutamate--cysteine ligase